jgi:pyruvate ferredoxin oxidoreductase gamma subunit
MLGAICRATAVVDMDTLLDNVAKSFGKKFARKIIDGNLDATRRGFEEAREG